MNALEKHVLRLIGENVDSPDVFTDDDSGMAQIRDSINDAIQELCMTTGSYTKTILLPLFANRQFYKISPKQDFFGFILQVWDRTRKVELEAISITGVSHLNACFLSDNGSPDYYGQLGEYFFISPFPTSEGKVLEIKAAMIPKAYTRDTDRIKVRDKYVNAVVYYAVGEYHASRGNAVRATEYLGQYLELAGLLSMDPRHLEKMRQLQIDAFSPRRRAE